MICIVNMNKVIDELGFRYDEYQNSFVLKDDRVKYYVDYDDVPNLLFNNQNYEFYLKINGSSLEELIEDYNEQYKELIEYLKQQKEIFQNFKKSIE